MGFSGKQTNALRRNLNGAHVRTREIQGRELSYIEGWHAIAEANRIFGFDGWDRETVDSHSVITRETRGTFLAVYTAKVRITVHAGGKIVVREGHGSGEGRGTSPGETHDIALKAAETDATKRALATFGKPFGLGLYLKGRAGRLPIEVGHSATPTMERLPPSTQSEHNESGALNLDRDLGVQGRQRSYGKRVASSLGIDKSALTFGEPRRLRDKAHLQFVAAQPCLLCGRLPSDPHHLRFAQPRALGLKVSDEFTVPLCRTHHRELHQAGNEAAWWHDMGIEPLEIAKTLWQETRSRDAALASTNKEREGTANLPEAKPSIPPAVVENDGAIANDPRTDLTASRQ